jgi:hypothetical protein
MQSRSSRKNHQLKNSNLLGSRLPPAAQALLYADEQMAASGCARTRQILIFTLVRVTALLKGDNDES